MTARPQPQPTSSGSLYERDIVAWSEQQASLLRAGRLAELDIANIAEEIEDVGKSERRELANRMAVLLAHLLKWQRQPQGRGKSWEATIRHQRERILRRLARTLSLKTSLADPDWWLDAWGDACLSVAKETGIGFDALPSDCPWTADQILDADFWPETP